MDIGDRYIKKKIQIKSEIISEQTVYKDYYIPILLTRNSEIIDYVDVKKDNSTYKIDRQEINPYFIELGFFGTISKIKTNYGSQLTPVMIEYIQDYFADTPTESSVESVPKTQKWFDEIGVNNFIFRLNREGTESNIETMEKLQTNWSNLFSKANYYPIDINN